MSVTTEVLNGIETMKNVASKKGESCVLVIFGASGDLARRKLLPALYNMSTGTNRAEPFDVLGLVRSKMTDEAFRETMREATATAKETRVFSESEWKDFSKRLFYS